MTQLMAKRLYEIIGDRRVTVIVVGSMIVAIGGMTSIPDYWVWDWKVNDWRGVAQHSEFHSFSLFAHDGLLLFGE